MEARKTILLSGVGRNWPVVEALCRRGGYNIVLYWSAVDEMVRRRGYDVGAFSDFFDEEAKGAAKEALERNLKSWFWALEHDEIKRRLRLFGEDHAEELRPLLRELVIDEFPKALATIEAVMNLKRRAGLDLVVVRNDVQPFTRAISLAARQMSVPVLHLTHGISNEENIHSELTASHLGVFGPRCRDWYVARGVDPGRIFVTGNPDWDKYARPVPSSEARRTLGMKGDARVVCLAASWYSSHTRLRGDIRGLTARALAAVARLQKRRDVHLIIKMHPNVEASPEWYSNLASDAGVRRFNVMEHDLATAIFASDLVISFSSNAGVEAVLAGKPVLAMEHGIFDDRDAVLFAGEDNKHLPSLIEAALYDEELERELAGRRPYTRFRFNYLNDGRATDRVRFLVESLLLAGDADPGAAESELAPSEIP